MPGVCKIRQSVVVDRFFDFDQVSYSSNCQFAQKRVFDEKSCTGVKTFLDNIEFSDVYNMNR